MTMPGGHVDDHARDTTGHHQINRSGTGLGDRVPDRGRQQSPPRSAHCRRAPHLHRRHRHGVHTFCVPDSSLTRQQSADLLAFRIGNYVRVGFVDPQLLAGMLETGTPLGVTGPEDLHIVSMSEDGKILCTAILRSLDGPDDTVRLRDTDRPYFPVEKVHGVGIFNGLRVLSDLPVVRIRELGGFVKTQYPEAPQLTVRATMEVGVALMRTLASTPMTLHVDALIGDLDPSVAKATWSTSAAEWWCCPPVRTRPRPAPISAPGTPSTTCIRSRC